MLEQGIEINSTICYIIHEFSLQLLAERARELGGSGACHRFLFLNKKTAKLSLLTFAVHIIYNRLSKVLILPLLVINADLFNP